MKKFFKKFRTLFLVVTVSAASVICFSFVDDYFEISKNLDLFSTTFREVNMYYVDSIEQIGRAHV